MTCVTKITNDLLIKPIEQMMARVELISQNPLKAAHDEEERLIYEEILDM